MFIKNFLCQKKQTRESYKTKIRKQLWPLWCVGTSAKILGYQGQNTSILLPVQFPGTSFKNIVHQVTLCRKESMRGKKQGRKSTRPRKQHLQHHCGPITFSPYQEESQSSKIPRFPKKTNCLKWLWSYLWILICLKKHNKPDPKLPEDRNVVFSL